MARTTVERPTDESVRHANRVVYNGKTLEEYERNESIFSPERQRAIRSVLTELAARAPSGAFVDVGCGTGNLLRLAREVFPSVIGVDQAERLLVQLKRRSPDWRLVAGPAHRIPLADDSVAVVGMYALLHHLLDPVPALGEAYRILRPGGWLYTDHDPNRAFWRMHGFASRLRSGGRRQSFGTELEDLAEVHHTYTDGLDPRGLAQALRERGFVDVEVRYRQTANAGLRGTRAFAARVLRAASRVSPWPGLYTHFQLLARKPE